ncbi:hypothetical protein [Halegenticoccus tardaugens]|uniref:hypothetical protein n=1 Tax=Halegenticoccus tardaugens TaxID=2071624 RepID=UPI0013E8F7FF|nr:hypothetical protein [Halegenticoccus tardaugens]
MAYLCLLKIVLETVCLKRGVIGSTVSMSNVVGEIIENVVAGECFFATCTEEAR